VKVSLGLPTHHVDGELATAAGVAEVAVAAEAAGFDAVFVTDHPAPSDRWLATGGHHALDPFVTLSFVAAATTRLRLHTNLLVLAYRNPFHSAKAIATLDSLSRGRMIVGVGAGYLEPEFEALGIDFARRNELTDEAIVTMRAAWSGERVETSGLGWRAAGNTLRPAPAQQPGPPIWVGGNSHRAIRRAVELGEGWMPMPSPAGSERRLHTPAIGSLDDLATRLQYARDHASAIGRTAPLEVVFMPLGLDMFTNAGVDTAAAVDSIAALAALGVTYLTVTLAGDTRAVFLDHLHAFADGVLRRVHDL
jgi:probable F420-dependent oxidoreductase